MPAEATALPYRFDGESYQVLLVTSRRRGKWILPKGKMEPGETAAQRAAIEAFEEAGVRGCIAAEPLHAASLVAPSRPKIYPLKVDAELAQWPEMAFRRRAWFSLREARSILQNERLKHALSAFAEQLHAD